MHVMFSQNVCVFCASCPPLGGAVALFLIWTVGTEGVEGEWGGQGHMGVQRNPSDRNKNSEVTPDVCPGV